MKNAALLMVLILLSGCSEDAENDAWSGSEIGVVICPFYSACGEGGALESCMRSYTNDNWVSEVSPYHREENTRDAKCVQNAKDCGGYLTCIASTAPCENARCDGDIAVKCVGGFESRDNCGAQGLNCVEGPRGPTCGVTGARCDGEFQCSGEIFLWCPLDYQEIPFGINCASEGKICAGIGFCADPVPNDCEASACAAAKSDVAYCIEGTRTTYACAGAAPEFECVLEGGEPRCELPPSLSDCDRDTPERCDANTAVVCSRGKSYRLPCPSPAKCTLNESGKVSCAQPS